MSAPEPPPIEPVEDDGVGAALVGLVLWALGALACLLWREDLAAAGHDWWLWSCLAGVGIGLGWLAFSARRSRVYAEDRARREQLGPAGEPPGSAHDGGR